jgi:hypothetical protein
MPTYGRKYILLSWEIMILLVTVLLSITWSFLLLQAAGTCISQQCRGSQTVGRAPLWGDTVGPLGGGSCLYERQMKYGRKLNIKNTIKLWARVKNKCPQNLLFKESNMVYVAEKPSLEALESLWKTTDITLPVVTSTVGSTSPQNL